MHKTKGEEGYVLIIVILFVVLIMGLSSVFMMNAITHTKQEEKVDDQHLVVTAAEMGVEYYASALTNEYNYRVPELEQKIQVQVSEDSSLEREELYYYIQNQVKDDLIHYFKEALNKFTTASNVPSGFSYQLREPITPPKLDPSNNSIVVSGVVLGSNKNGEELTELNFLQTFNIPFLQSTYEPGLPNKGGGIELPTLEEVNIKIILDEEKKKHNASKPLAYCQNITEGKKLVNEKCYVDNNNNTIQNNPLNLTENSLLYSSDGLTLKKGGSLTDSQMYTKNKMEIEDTTFSSDNSIAYFGNDLTADQSIDISNKSNIFVNGSVHLHNNHTYFTDSKLFVKTDLKIEGVPSTNVVNSDLVIGNKLYIKNNSLSIKKSNIHVGNHTELLTGSLIVEDNSNMHINGQLEINNSNELSIKNNSNIYIGNFVKLPDGSVNLDNNSTLFINDHLTIGNEGKLNVQANSRVCIAKKFNISKSHNIFIGENSYVYLTEKPHEITHSRIVVKNKNEMSELCASTPATEQEELNFETLAPIVEVEVTY